MADLMQQARELLAAEYERDGRVGMAALLREPHDLVEDDDRSVRAIAAALRAAPEGFVMVPVEPTEEMLRAGWRDEGDYGVSVGSIYKAMLAARPQGVRNAT
jgi:hypothetical protein